MRRSVRLDQSVAQTHNSPRVLRDFLFMRDDNQGVPLPVELLEEIHDLDARF
jgi:hypothetical protein